MKRIVTPVLLIALLAAPVAAQVKTREPAGVEGIFGWFPENRRDLKAAVDKYLADAGDVKVEGKPIAIIAPHAGFRYSGSVAGSAWKAVAGRKYDRVIILAPSHEAGFPGGHVGDWDYYSTPLASTPLDKVACRKLLVSTANVIRTRPGLEAAEHSVQNQLPFLQTVLPDAKIIPVIIGGGRQSDDAIRKLGDEVRSVATADTLYVVSSDFTHYGDRFYYTPYKDRLKESIRAGDQGAIDLICANDLVKYRACMAKPDAPTICGAGPIAVLLRVLEGRKDIRGALLRYANSGDRTGDYNNSVSYAAIVLSRIEGGAEAPLKVTTVVDEGAGRDRPEKVPDALSEDDQKLCLVMAREQLERIIKDRRVVDPRDYRWDIGRKLLSQGATFVTLKNRDELRGCIGDARPVKPIYMSVIQNTVNASRDSRFRRNPITEPELLKIDIEITVLTPFRLVPSYTDIVVGRHGVYMEKEGRAAIFLPQVATEQKWDRDTLLKQLSLKAQLGENAYKEPDCKFWVFEGQIFSESGQRRKEAEKERSLHWND